MRYPKFVRPGLGIGLIAAASLAAGGAAYALTTQEDATDANAPVASLEQQVMLDDGTVTLAERESAAHRAIDCIAALGLKLEVREGAGLRRTAIGFAAPTMEQAKEGHRCIEQHLDAVDSAYAESIGAVRDPAAIQGGATQFLRCVSDAGVTGVPQELNRESLNELSHRIEGALITSCADQVEEATGYRPW